jgi:hypothetical protein
MLKLISYIRSGKAIESRKFLFLFLLVMVYQSCKQPQEEVAADQEAMQLDSAFKSFWFSGKAELSSYHLTQSRYGEDREGSATILFVTEDFLSRSLVKKEFATKEAAYTVLKTNFIRDFTTGIYDYNLMSSVFTPVHQPAAATKVTTSVQEWCGHSWLQINRSYPGYDIRAYSYFQAVADTHLSMKNVLLEDNLWNQIRLDPASIPMGEQLLLPGTQAIRLKHLPLAPTLGIISREKDMHSDSLQILSISYPASRRVIKIWYTAAFPHTIPKWEEISDAGVDSNHTTTATLHKRIKLPYWELNRLQDSSIRKKFMPSDEE